MQPKIATISITTVPLIANKLLVRSYFQVLRRASFISYTVYSLTGRIVLLVALF
jgi:hypothetical protein